MNLTRQQINFALALGFLIAAITLVSVLSELQNSVRADILECVRIQKTPDECKKAMR